MNPQMTQISQKEDEMPIEVKGLKETLQRMKTIEEARALIGGLRSAALYLKGKLSVYPPKQTGMTRAEVYGSTFKSEKQQRYFFYALRKGIINVPYSQGADARSQRFKASWTVREEAGGMRQVIRNDTTYGPYLMDTDKQSKYMARLGWKTVDEIAASEAETVSKYALYDVQKML